VGKERGGSGKRTSGRMNIDQAPGGPGTANRAGFPRSNGPRPPKALRDQRRVRMAGGIAEGEETRGGTKERGRDG
jgi:hypothetical protein